MALPAAVALSEHRDEMLMRMRIPARVAAWALLATTFVCWAVTAGLWCTLDTAGVRTPGRDTAGLLIVIGAAVLVFGTTGALIAMRRPENPVGWIFASAGAIVALKSATGVYADLGRFTSTALPLLEWVAWLSNWVWILAIGPFATFVFLLFPTGRPPSRRWNVVGWLAGGAIASAGASAALTPGPLDQFPEIGSPIPTGAWLRPVVAVLDLGFALLIVAAALSVVSLVVRARRGDAVVREQVKWIAYVGGLLAIGLAYAIFSGNFTVLPAIGIFGPIAAIAVASAIAIQRYRLFEIDKLISRTISYGVVTAMLIAAFALIVLVPTAVVGTGGSTPDYLVAIATLLVAAVFRPLHRRVQRAVDRRFNRASYDAEHTLQAWATRVRHQTDFRTLEGDLVDVIGRTMQPERVWIWLPQASDS